LQANELDNQPYSMTLLETGYAISGSVSDYDPTFRVGERGLLQITNAVGATKTFFVVKLPASGEEVQNLTCMPSEKHLGEHRRLVDTVDLCITYCLGSSVLFDRGDATEHIKITDNFEEKFNERQIATGMATTHHVSFTAAACISATFTTTIEAIEQVASLAGECDTDEHKKDILNLYREGTIRPYVAMERWYKIVEALEAQIAWKKKLSAKEKKFLHSYPQLFRHYKSKANHINAEKGLIEQWPDELESPQKGIETYHSYLRTLLREYLG